MKRIVIAGGGYAGILAANRLCRALYRDATELQRELFKNDQDPPSAYVDNFYLGYGLDYIAVIASNPFRTVWWPRDAERINDLIASERAGLVVESVRKANDEHALTQDQAYFFFNDGWAAAYVRWVADAQKYGTRTVPITETQDVEVQPAMAPCRIGCGWPPAISSATMTPSWLALWASQGAPAMSPMA